jgi:hypothetical protein
MIRTGDVPGRATLDDDVVDVDVGLRDWTRLDVVDCFAARGRRKIEQERWLGCGVGECLSCGFQWCRDDRCGHGSVHEVSSRLFHGTRLGIPRLGWKRWTDRG